MKIYLTTEKGAYIAEIDELLYKAILEKFPKNNRSKKTKIYSTYYNEKIEMSEIKIQANKLKNFLEKNFINMGDSLIEENIEKKLKKYFGQVLKLLKSNNDFFMEEEEIKKLEETYTSFYNLSIIEWEEAIKEIIEMKLKRENFLEFNLDFQIEDIFYKDKNEKEIGNKEIGNFILEKDEVLSNFESLYNSFRNSQNYRIFYNLPFYFPVMLDFYFLDFIFKIFEEKKLCIIIKDDIQISLYNIFKNYEKETYIKYEEIIRNYLEMDKLQKKLIIVYIISIFEDFMKKVFSRLIFFDGGYFIKILGKYQNIIKIPPNLKEIPDFSRNLMKKVKHEILKTPFHNPRKINDYLGILYQVDDSEGNNQDINNFYDPERYASFIIYRHSICHRAGNNENNEELEPFDVEELEEHIKNIKSIINKVVEAIKVEE